jgi:hypothetical protein
MHVCVEDFGTRVSSSRDLLSTHTKTPLSVLLLPYHHLKRSCFFVSVFSNAKDDETFLHDDVILDVNQNLKSTATITILATSNMARQKHNNNSNKNNGNHTPPPPPPTPSSSSPTCHKLDTGGGLIWNDLSVCTKNGTFLVKNCSGRIPNGHLCGLLGPSGAGKVGQTRTRFAKRTLCVCV